MRGRAMNGRGIENAQRNMAEKYQKIQKKIEDASNEIGRMDFIGCSYDDNIKVKFTGEKKAVDIDIRKEETLNKMVEDGILKNSDIENENTKEALYNFMDAFKDLVVVGINDAGNKIDQKTDEKISAITKGMHIPNIN